MALLKITGATESKLKRTISLMSRVRNKIKPERAEEQCGFVKRKSITNFFTFFEL